MTWKPFVWYDKTVRRQQLDDFVDRANTATFGFREMPTAEKEYWVRRHFDRVAPKYDFMNTLLSFGIHYLWKHIAVGMLALSPGERVLDICGGTGDLSIMAWKRVAPQGRVTVYDINRKMIEAGRHKSTNRAARQALGYIQGNAEAISCAGDRFDAAMVGFGIRNVTHLERAFREMYRVLRPGGRLLCLEFSKPVNPTFRKFYDFHSFVIMPFLGGLLTGNPEGYRCLPETIRLFSLPEELSALLARIGFTGIRYRRFTNGIAVAHIARKG